MRIWDPFTEMTSMREEMDRLAARITRGLGRDGVVHPAAHLSQDDAGYVLEIDMPGVRAEDLHLEACDRVISIRAERTMGQRQWRYEQRISIPEPIAIDGVEAELTDGVLQVRIPTAGQETGRAIPVRSAAAALGSDASDAGTGQNGVSTASQARPATEHAPPQAA